MILKKCLGIHYCRHAITAVMVEKQEMGYRFLKDIQIAVPSDVLDKAPESYVEQDPFDVMLDRLVSEVPFNGDKRPPSALSIGGEFYQSQSLHSEFTDEAQIRQTLRFDVEEEFVDSADATTLCYQLGADSEQGRNLTVHSIRRNRLEPLLNGFYEHGLDAMIAQPDIDCWCSYLRDQEGLAITAPTLFLAAAGDLIYMLVIDGHYQTLLARTFLAADQDRVQTVIREYRRCIAPLGTDHLPQSLYYHRQGLSTETVKELERTLSLSCRELPEPDPMKAFAVGAAICWLGNRVQNDFRSDGLAPRSLTKARQKALLGLAVAVTMFFLVLMIHLYLHAWKYQRIETKAQADLNQAWIDAGTGSPVPNRLEKIPKEIKKYADTMRIKSRSFSALSSSDSASNTLLLVLQLLNTLYNNAKAQTPPAAFDLQLDSLQLDKTNARLSGSVPNMDALVKIRDVLTHKDSRLEVENWGFVLSTGAGQQGQPSERRSFNLPLRVVKGNPETVNSKTETNNDI